jgi:hypothetical protein
MGDACYCDYEPAEFCDTTIRVAKKAHRCGECGYSIRPGERYEVAAGKWEGQISVHKTCGRCLALREYIQAHVPCFCWAYGGLLNDAEETLDQYRYETPGLWFGALRLVARIEGRVK